MLNTMIGIRLKKDDKDLLEKVCAARGEDVSDFVRRAIFKELAELSFFPDDVKKALGLKVGGVNLRPKESGDAEFLK